MNGTIASSTINSPDLTQKSGHKVRRKVAQAARSSTAGEGLVRRVANA